MRNTVHLQDRLSEAATFAYALRMAATELSSQEGKVVDALAEQVEKRIAEAIAYLEKGKAGAK